MFKKLSFLFFLCFFAKQVLAQQLPVCTQPTPSENCEDACVICNAGFIFGSSGGFAADGAIGFCSGIQNDQWYAFIASASLDATITVYPSNCANGDGLQIAIYKDCSSGFIACDGGGTGQGNTPISVTFGTVAGQIYYMVLDGFGADVCDFQAVISPANAFSNLPLAATPPIQGPNRMCPGATATYSIPAVIGASHYAWWVPAGTLINGLVGPGPYMFEGPEGARVNLIFGQTPGLVRVRPSNACQNGSEQAMTVSFAPTAPFVLPDLVVCRSGAPYRLPWDALTDSAGVYTHVFQKSNGCDSTVQVRIVYKEFTSEPTPVQATLNVAPPLCAGSSDGSLAVTATGGDLPYRYQWSNGDTTRLISALDAGVYTVTISDTNGCTRAKTERLIDPPVLTVTSDTIRMASDSSTADGRATLLVQGGTGTYTYLWSNGASTDDISNVLPATYTVIVRDQNQCADTLTLDVPYMGQLQVRVENYRLACFGSKNGTLAAAVRFGEPPLSFQWSTGATTATISGLEAGIYTLTVRDALNTAITATATVSAPSRMYVNGRPYFPNCNVWGILVQPRGGTPGYTYRWANGGLSGNNPTGLQSGFYRLTVSDAAGCEKDTTIEVGFLPVPLRVDLRNSTLPCQGTAAGVARAEATGGVKPYRYEWSNGATTTVIGNLTGGTYEVTVTDFAGCTVANTINIPLMPAVLSATPLSPGPLVCGDSATGKAAVLVNGGVFPYRFSWNTGRTTSSIFNLTVGTYGVTVTDAVGCTVQTTVTVRGIPGLQVAQHAPCTDSVALEAVVNPAGAPYRFDWQHLPDSLDRARITNLSDGTYLINVVAANGCSQKKEVVVRAKNNLQLTLEAEPLPCGSPSPANIKAITAFGSLPLSYQWSNGASGASVSNLLPLTTYTVTVRDAAGCSAVKTVKTPAVQAPISINYVVQGSCGSSGSISLNVSGGTGIYTYMWSGNFSGPSISGLVVGIYEVTVSDDSGCRAVQSILVPFIPSSLTISSSLQAPTCQNDSSGYIVLAASGGVFPYSYHWAHLSVPVTDNRLINLRAGTYTVTVKDAVGCNKTSTFVLSSPPSLMVSSDICDYEVSMSTTGGMSPYQYKWEDGNTATVRSLSPGNYIVTISDKGGCSIVKNVCLPANLPPCTIIQGGVFWNRMSSCQSAGTFTGLGNWTILALGTSGKFLYAKTKSDGLYTFRAAPGIYSVIAVPPDNAYELCNPAPVFINITQRGSKSNANFFAKKVPACTALQVDITADPLGSCGDTYLYRIRYCNNSPVYAPDVVAEVSFPPSVVYKSASLSGVSVGNGTYRFPLGLLLGYQCGEFFVEATLRCPVKDGQAHCVKARISSTTDCVSDWKGGILSLTSRCLGDSLYFTIKNSGQGVLTQNAPYYLIRDGILVSSNQINFFAAGDSLRISVPADGSTWRLESRQEPGGPGPAYPALSVEGCSATGTFSTGFLTQLPDPAPGPWEDTDCSIVDNAPATVRKSGYPPGYGVNRYITDNTPLSYTIRFRNPGNDTVTSVVIRDTLSANLDPLTVRPGAGSHPYNFELTGNGILIFEMPAMMLTGSQEGFVSYNVLPKVGLALQTPIPNRATVYFDAKLGLTTNTTLHRINRDFVIVGTWSPERPAYGVHVAPQPFSTAAQIWLEGAPTSGNYVLEVVDMRGAVVSKMESDHPRFLLERNELPEGMYGFQIRRSGALLGVGKLIIQAP